MGTSDITVKKRRWKQLSEQERYKIESFLQASWSIARISLEVTERNSDWTERTIYRAYHGDIKHKECSSNKGRTVLGLSKELYNYMLSKFRNKYSPDAIIGELRRGSQLKIIIHTDSWRQLNLQMVMWLLILQSLLQVLSMMML